MPTQASKKEAEKHSAVDAFDLSVLERATQGDRALAREVLALFDGQAKMLFAKISAAADVQTRRELAHRLKGAARGVGALAVAAAAEEIETAGEDPVALSGSLARLSACVAQARLALAKGLSLD